MVQRQHSKPLQTKRVLARQDLQEVDVVKSAFETLMEGHSLRIRRGAGLGRFVEGEENRWQTTPVTVSRSSNTWLRCLVKQQSHMCVGGKQPVQGFSTVAKWRSNAAPAGSHRYAVLN
jgi:hypothetical protein